MDADNKHPERRIVAKQLMKSGSPYDAEEYISLLDDALNSILSPFISERRDLTRKVKSH